MRQFVLPAVSLPPAWTQTTSAIRSVSPRRLLCCDQILASTWLHARRLFSGERAIPLEYSRWLLITSVSPLTRCRDSTFRIRRGAGERFRKHRYDERMFKAQDQELLLRTAATSRFASVDAVLLGYRQEDLDLKKSIKGRAVFSHAIWHEGRKSARYAQVMSAISAQVAKCAVEAVAIGLGFQNQLIKRRYIPLRAEEIAQWRSVWAAMTAGRER